MSNTAYDKSKRLAFGCIVNPLWGWDTPQMAGYVQYIAQIAYDCKKSGLDGVVSIICPESFDTAKLEMPPVISVNFVKMPDGYFRSNTMNEMLTCAALYEAFADYLYLVVVSPGVKVKNVHGLVAYLDYTLQSCPIVYDWIGSIVAVGNNVHFRKVSKCVEICKKYGESSEGDLKYFILTHINEITKKQS